jgi:uncharacterized protein (TIGR02001 family)
MRKTLLMGLSALALTTAFAAPAAAAELGAGFSINGGATVVSDYRFRGISQSFKNFAVQGTVSLSHESGLYLTLWGSSIDDYVVNGGDVELDIVGGYKHTFEGGPTIDVGATYYYYPGSGAFGFGNFNSDFIEPYLAVSHTVGPVTGKILGAYAPKQKAQSAGFNAKDDNLYLAGDLTAAIPDTGVSLTAHIGHTWGPSYASLGFKNYTDWSIGATYTTGPLTLGVSYVDTNKTFFTESVPPCGGCGVFKDIMKETVVGSIGVSF